MEGDDVFLLADKTLDCQQYHDTNESVTWETSTLRTWLNDTFINNAFSASERSAIPQTRVVNNDSSNGTEGGNDTMDQVYLLSIDEVTNSEYGFSVSGSDYAKDRRALNTAYAKAKGAYTNTSTEYAGNGYWWLRSPGSFSNYASYVDSLGYVSTNGNDVYFNDVGVRPALHVNLTSLKEWKKAGTVTSNETVIQPTSPPTEKPTPGVTIPPSQTPKETQRPTIRPTITPTKRPTMAPTKTPTADPGTNQTPTPTESPKLDETPIPTTIPEINITPAPTDQPGSMATPTANPGTNRPISPKPTTKPDTPPSSGDGTVIPSSKPSDPSVQQTDDDPEQDDRQDDELEGGKKSGTDNTVKAGKLITISGLQYKVKKSTKKEKTVVLWKVVKKKLKKVNIPNTVKIQSASYKVVEISKNAFKGCGQLQTATIGKEIRIIGKGAFSGCKKIKKIIIRSKKLKKIGKGAFSGVSRKAKIQVPKSKVALYRKLMKKG